MSSVEDGLAEELPLRLDLWKHSPTGFEWGYGGAGPAQLALAILADVTGDDIFAVDKCHQFTFEVVAGLDRDQWAIPARKILGWAAVNGISENERFRWLSKEKQTEIIDRAVVTEVESECCGASCSYHATHNHREYRAFAVCTACGASTEF